MGCAQSVSVVGRGESEVLLMAIQSLSRQGNPTMLESLIQVGSIQAPILSFNLARQTDFGVGEIVFGGTNPNRYNARFMVVLPNVSRVGFWEVTMTAIAVNGVSAAIMGCTIILDTGTVSSCMIY